MSNETTPPPEPPKTAIQRTPQYTDVAITGEGVQLTTIADAIVFGRSLIDGGLAPKGFTTPGAIVWAVQTGYELGLKPTQSLRAFYMSPAGKPSMYIEAALALCVSKGVLDPEYHGEYTGTGPGEDLTFTWHFRRTNRKHWQTVTFSVSEAKVAGLVKPDSNWIKWPKRMTRWRAIGFALHDNFADVLWGLPLEGEIDHLSPKDVGGMPGPPEDSAPPEPPKPPRAAVVDPLLDTVPPEQQDPIEAELVQPERPKEEVLEDLRQQVKTIEDRTRPGCECPESGWKTVKDEVMCSACGAIIGSAV